MKKILIILLNLIFFLMSSIPVFSAVNVDISITAMPQMSNGILTFVITYVTDTQLDFDWTVDATVDKIMIRGKYGSYPNDIPNENTAPSDGYLVYYGNLLEASDTSMNFEENTGPIYYSAWAQKLDGTWYTTTKQGNKESAQLILLAFVGIILAVGIINFGFLRNSFIPYKLAGAMLWIIPIVWIMSTPPSILTAGSTLQVATMLVLIGIGFISLFGAFSKNMQIKTTQSYDGVTKMKSEDGSGWHVPSWMHDKNSVENLKKDRAMYRSEYRSKIHRAVYPNGEIRNKKR